jgi:hypothetical protein
MAGSEEEIHYTRDPFPRVTPLEEITDNSDAALIVKSLQQAERDRVVYWEKLELLKQRFRDCYWKYGEDHHERCKSERERYWHALHHGDPGDPRVRAQGLSLGFPGSRGAQQQQQQQE